LQLLARGRSAEEIVAILTAGDPGRDQRQLHVIDRDGRTALIRAASAWSGAVIWPTGTSRWRATCWRVPP
jgi:uncharacterized Ntn-hydrolase superfamily protein